MNRNSPFPLWVGASIGVVVLAAVYVSVQRVITAKSSSPVQQQAFVPKANTQASGSPLVSSSTDMTSVSASVPFVLTRPVPSPQLVTGSSVKEVNGWKTYHNDQFHFEVTVPDTFNLEETTYPVTDAEVKEQDIAVQYGLDVLDQSDTIHYFGLAIGESKFSLDQYEQTKRDPIRYDSAWTVKARSINGIRGFDTYGYAAEAHLYSEYFDFAQDGNIYTIFLDPVLEGRISSENYPGGSSGGCCNDYDPAKKGDVYRTILASFKVY
jgi:hypothetical protein